MKKILTLSLLSMLIFCQCTICTLSDDEYTGIFIYTNDTEWTLSVVVTTNLYSSDVAQEIFTLLPGKQHSIKLQAKGGYPRPLILRGGNNVGSYTSVKNGVVQVTSYQKQDDDLYNIEKYKLLSTNNGTRKYEFKFEPSFFDNGEPLE